MMKTLNQGLFIAIFMLVFTSMTVQAATPEENFEKGKELFYSKEYKKSLKYFKKSAEKGHMEAQYWLGALYTGNYKEIPWDSEKVLYWFEKAADQGHAEAAYGIAMRKNTSFAEMVWPDDDYTNVIPFYERAAKLGNAISMYWLSEVYAKDQTVHADAEKHRYWLFKAAEANHAAAQFYVGKMYNMGDGVEKDVKTSFMWLEKSAINKYPQAQFLLGQAYFNGMPGIVEKDDEKGEAWMQFAALNGEKQAYIELGMRHLHGAGVAKDPKKGYLYFIELMKIAEDNELYKKVAFKMGEIYALGGFGEVDPVAAYSWFVVAKEKGNTEAPKAISYIWEKFSLDHSDKYEAERRAKRCIETNYEICRPMTEAEKERERELIKAIWEAMHPEDKN